MSTGKRLFLITLFLTGFSTPLRAEISPGQPHELSDVARLSLAKEFVAKISKGFSRADRQLMLKSSGDMARGLHEGDALLLRVRLNKKLILDSAIISEVKNGRVLVSLPDFVNGLEFPIDVDLSTGKGSGWYIREKKGFGLDAKLRRVVTDNGVFEFSPDVDVSENDIFVPASELGQWFGLKLTINVSSLYLDLESSVPLPVEERLARAKFIKRNKRAGPPKLPLQEEPAKAIDYPFVDVTGSAGYSRDGENGQAANTARASVRTNGDFAKGTLTTLSSLNKEDKLTDIRATYKRESLKPELLGPLGARKYELGNVYTPRLELQNYSTTGLGAHLTNADPLRATLLPSTDIRGTALPGWDVELYRDNALLSYQRVDESGEYVFSGVDLFGNDNNFRVVLYGPQGEVNEEEINIPVDTKRLSEYGSAYDIAVMARNEQIYRKASINSEDKGAPTLTARYEVPLSNSTAGSLGFETTQQNGDQVYTSHAGISTKFAGTLFNLDGAVDNENEMAAQLVARREINRHQLRNEIAVSTKKYGVKENVIDDNLLSLDFENEDEKGADVFSERFSVSGPLNLDLGRSARYNFDAGYAVEADDDNRVDLRAGFNTSLWKKIGFNEQLNYSRTEAEGRLESLTTLAGSWGRNRLRFIADYNILPETRLDAVLVNARRYVTNNAEVELEARHRMDPQLTEGRAQLNWKAGFADISPRVVYNSENDLALTLNTRFGLARNPQTGKIRTFDRTIASNGGVSAFVFLDKDGDRIFNGNDEPIPDAIISAPQNGGRATTDEEGYAFLNRLTALKPTDVYVDETSLGDPYWISGFQGVSVIPREGHVTTLEFPVHMAGEMDGTLYARDSEGNSQTLRGVDVGLYATDGKKVMAAVSETDGFYLFSKIPPGDYYLLADEEKLPKGVSRPMPQKVHVGFEGTTIYANNIYFEDGRPDVPVKLLADAAVYGDAADRYAGRTFLLNLGKYKSRLSMGLAWFKMRALGRNLFDDVDLLQKPSESIPADEKGNYILRASVRGNDLDKAYKKCAIIAAHGNFCGLEVLPGGLEQPRVAAK